MDTGRSNGVTQGPAIVGAPVTSTPQTTALAPITPSSTVPLVVSNPASSAIAVKPAGLPGTLPNSQTSIVGSPVNSQSAAASMMASPGPGSVSTAGGAGGSKVSVSLTSQQEVPVLDKRRLQELVKEVDPLEQLDEDVEELLLQIADDFIDNVVTSACQVAKHRKANTVEVKDVQLHLERNWNMWIPGFGSEDIRPYKRAATTEAHKQRMALIKKTLKKT